ncbi:hypothetical protein AB0K09_15500 [Streptomyces sp. NPDC049577]|uniref:hypothetical protein n=1 Tax=Streptomyces sp. NPDC049577 TaxID=3155153 RepID=UPI00342C315F
MTSRCVTQRLCRTTLPVAAALGLLVGLPMSAQAANGQFAYVRSDTGTNETIANPPNDHCLPLSGGASRAANITDTTAIVYADASCQQPLTLVGAGTSWQSSGTPARSVRFGSGPSNAGLGNSGQGNSGGPALTNPGTANPGPASPGTANQGTPNPGTASPGTHGSAGFTNAGSGSLQQPPAEGSRA